VLTFRSFLVLVCLALPGWAGEIAGAARVIDGDTLALDGVRIRLHGIDAPEMAQTCRRKGKPWRCGEAARRALAAMVADSTVRCRRRGIDRYGRVVARCRTARTGDLGAALVAEGAAFAYRRYSREYLDEERTARAARRGVWSGSARRPESFRHHRSTAARAPGRPPEGCRIKGNISSNGRIFHAPGSRHYARTRIDPARGERWFCSAAAARAAGWRAPRG